MCDKPGRLTGKLAVILPVLSTGVAALGFGIGQPAGPWVVLVSLVVGPVGGILCAVVAILRAQEIHGTVAMGVALSFLYGLSALCFFLL